MWNNYHSTWPIDHDDGSCYYHDHHNFLIYGGAKVRAASPAFVSALGLSTLPPFCALRPNVPRAWCAFASPWGVESPTKRLFAL